MAFNHRSFEYLDALSIQVARVAMAAAMYEDELTIAIAAALNLNALQCNALVRPLAARAKLDLIDRLVAGSNDSIRIRVRKHTRQVGKLFDHRNALIHGTFGHDAEDHVTVTSYMGKHKLAGKRERWSADRVSDLADMIVKRRGEIDEVTVLIATALQKQEPLP